MTKATEKYLETNSDNSLGCLYAKNLLSELLTYQVVDLERSFALNEELLAMTHDNIHPEQKLSFDRNAYKYKQPTIGSRVLFTGVMAIAIFDPSSWGPAKEHIVGKKKRYRIKDTEFVKRFFTIDIGQIRTMSDERLAYLNDLIGG